MTFNEAINEVIYNNNIVWRQAYYHEHDYGDYDRPWSEWKRIRMEDDDPPYMEIFSSLEVEITMWLATYVLWFVQYGKSWRLQNF